MKNNWIVSISIIFYEIENDKESLLLLFVFIVIPGVCVCDTELLYPDVTSQAHCARVEIIATAVYGIQIREPK